MSRARGVRFVSFLRNKSLFFVVVLPGGQKKKKALCAPFCSPWREFQRKNGKRGEKCGKIGIKAEKLKDGKGRKEIRGG